MSDPIYLDDTTFHSVICTRLFGVQHQAVLVVDGVAKIEGPWRWSESKAITDSVRLNFVYQLMLAGGFE
jgi:hypothetical protein